MLLKWGMQSARHFLPQLPVLPPYKLLSEFPPTTLTTLSTHACFCICACIHLSHTHIAWNGLFGTFGMPCSACLASYMWRSQATAVPPGARLSVFQPKLCHSAPKQPSYAYPMLPLTSYLWFLVFPSVTPLSPLFSRLSSTSALSGLPAFLLNFFHPMSSVKRTITCPRSADLLWISVCWNLSALPISLSSLRFWTCANLLSLSP